MGDDVRRERFRIEPFLEVEIGDAEGFELGEVFRDRRKFVIERGAHFGRKPADERGLGRDGHETGPVGHRLQDGQEGGDLGRGQSALAQDGINLCAAGGGEIPASVAEAEVGREQGFWRLDKDGLGGELAPRAGRQAVDRTDGAIGDAPDFVGGPDGGHGDRAEKEGDSGALQDKAAREAEAEVSFPGGRAEREVRMVLFVLHAYTT